MVIKKQQIAVAEIKTKQRPQNLKLIVKIVQSMCKNFLSKLKRGKS